MPLPGFSHMDKSAVYDMLVKRVCAEYDRMHSAAKDTADRAMEGEGRMKSRYDTKRIEGSYLADSLSKRTGELLVEIQRAHEFKERASQVSEDVRVGSLVSLQEGDTVRHFFILPFLGGEDIEAEGQTITVLTPSAPLAQALLGRRTEDEPMFREHRYRIRAIE